MQSSRTFVLMAFALAAAACGHRVTQESGGDVDLAAMTERDWGGEIRGTGGWSSIRGSAYVRPISSDSTRVSLTIDRGIPGGAYAWEIGEGQCGSSDVRALAPITAFPAVFLDKTGRGAAVGTVGMRLDRARPYVVNVFSTTDQRTTVIACGKLTF
jgi:hypothetical protein